MRLPLFTVVVPVYNSEQVLERSIQSILNQSYKNFELLLVDDGSNDRSIDICYEYSKLDMRISILGKTNGGVSSARNLGIDNAKGEWVVFCDSDDWVYKDWLSNYWRGLNDADLVTQGVRIERELINGAVNCRDLVGKFEGCPSEYVEEMFKQELLGYVWNKCFKLSIIDEYHLRFNEQLNFREDEEFVLRYLARSQKVLSITNIGYHYYAPNFHEKYKCARNLYHLNLSLCTSIKTLNLRHDADYLYKVVNDTASLLITDSVNKSFSSKWRMVMKCRHALNEHILKCRLFVLVRYVIFIDVSSIFATFILSFYQLLKKIKRDNIEISY